MLQDSINRIKDLPIEDILSRYIKLKRSGSVLTANCPFHSEKSASFTIFSRTNTWKCFGCGEHGDAIAFVQKFNSIPFIEVVEEICKTNNIEFERKQYTKEDEQRAAKREQLAFVNSIALDYYVNLFKNATETRKNEINSRFAGNALENFAIGYSSPEWKGFYSYARSKGVLEESLIASGIIKQNDKGDVFDFFRDRIIFPIHDAQGRVVAFGGRKFSDAEKESPKYLNTSETELYNKSRVIYGLFFARKAISTSGYAYLVEGYTDVITMHTAGKENTIAPCGTALAPEHAELIKKYTNEIVMVYDGDAAGMKAACRNGSILLSAGINVRIAILPDGEDPDSYFKPVAEKIIESKELNISDYILWSTDKELFGTEADPIRRGTALRNIAHLLTQVSDKNIRSSYINTICSTYKKQNIKKSDIQNAINDLEYESLDSEELELDEENLPKYVDKKEYMKYGFYEGQNQERNQYFFKKKGRLSNFIMIPLYHIESVNDTRKLFEINNHDGERKVLEFEMAEMVSVQKFQQAIESKGNYVFEGGINELIRLKRKWYDCTKYGKEIQRLGWQQDGFWAWGNGITNPVDGSFIPVDANGFLEMNGKNYFIPAFSSLYMTDDKIFRDERKFIYVLRNNNNNATLRTWSEQFLKVFGEQSRLSICFYLTALFSDHIFATLDNLPILNIYGQKGTGKNEQAMALMSLFGYPQNELQLHNATKVGISMHLEMFINALTWVDEYKNSLPIEFIEALKGIYNRNGRTRGSINKGSRKENTAIDSMAIITGQEMLTVDPALLGRVIMLFYYKISHTQEEHDNLEILREICKKGLSHITAEILKYRKLVVENYRYKFNEVQKEIKERLNSPSVNDRILRNIVTVVTTYRVLEKELDLPFTRDELMKTAIDVLLKHNELMSSTDELMQFWKMLETLVDRHMIQMSTNFKIVHVNEIWTGGSNSKRISLEPSENVLLLKWSGIYQLYAEYSNRAGVKPLPESTLLHYLESSGYFVCKKKNVRFRDCNTTAHCFYYDRLNDINLIRSEEPERDDITEVPKPADIPILNKNPGVPIPEEKLPF